MDTKEFYDACRDEGIDFRSTEPGDCMDVAIKLLLKDKEWWEVWLDGMAVAMQDGDLAERMAESLYVIRDNLDTLHNDRRSNDASTLIYARSTAYHTSNLGSVTFDAIMKEVISYAEKYIDQWFDDAAGYQHEMDQCAREDYYDAQREERMLNNED